jgi:excisionase family DNA binding protein
MQPLLTKNEACQRMRICLKTLDNLIAAGDAPRFARIGRRVLFKEADLVAFIDRHSK